MIYDRNLEALKLNPQYERVVKYLKEKKIENKNTTVSIQKSYNNQPIIVYQKQNNEYYLNSRYNPLFAAKIFMKMYSDITDKSGLIMFGLSNGMFAREYFDSIKKDVFLFVYEPSADIFYEVIQNIDISELIANNKFHLFVEGINEGEFGYKLETCNNYENYQKIKYTVLPLYKKLFPNEYNNFVEAIKQQAMGFQITINTALKMGERYCYTSIQNMRYLPGCRNGFDYVGVFPEDLPAIVVAAGPSLEKNVDLLKQVKGKALVIVVDSAIKTVYSRGIKPDFVITIDNQKPLRLFDADGIEDAFLLADGAANTDVFDAIHPHNLIFYSSASPVWDRLFASENTQIKEVYSGGSVALDALAMSIVMGFKKVILIGQDLALTGGKQYADGDSIDIEKAIGDGMIVVKDIYGNDIVTKADYRDFIRNIEDVAYTNPDVEIIDATEGGAFKRYTTIMTLQEAIDKYCNREYPLGDIIESIPRRFTNKGELKIQTTLQNMKKHILDIEEQMRYGAEECGQASEMLLSHKFDKKRLQEINKDLRELDDKYVNMEENTLFAYIASRDDYNFSTKVHDEEDNDIAEAIRLYENSEQYYNGIAEVSPKIVAMIDDCLEKLKKQYNLTDD